MTAEGTTGRLVLAGTPLGRASDASPGLKAALATADVIAAEDTRRLRRLASRLEVTLGGSVISFYDAVEHAKVPALIDKMRAGATVVLVTDAGMPCVSDPGYRLVSAAHDAAVTVTSVPGPSAAVTALALSGLPSDRFTFEGFLPRKKGERAKVLAGLADEQRTMIFFESVHRLSAAMKAMTDAFGTDRAAALCRELTKTYEEVRRGTLGELAAGSEDVRGEVTIVIEGKSGYDGAAVPDSDELAAQVAELVDEGSSRRDAVDAVAVRTGLPRRVVYSAATSKR